VKELDPLFEPPDAGSARPMSYRQGRILTFNKITLQNTVLVGTTVFTDLPLLGIAEATTLEPGDAVGLMALPGEYAILGQMVRPNTPDAATAISALSSNIYSATVATFEQTNSGIYTDLATLGPTLQNVRIGTTGRCLVILSAIINVGTVASGGEMGYAITGATTVSPGDIGHSVSEYAAANIANARTAVYLRSGLNAGLHTFTAKYLYGGGASSAGFSFRNITVVAL
jgi:hypothetical protein